LGTPALWELLPSRASVPFCLSPSSHGLAFPLQQPLPQKNSTKQHEISVPDKKGRALARERVALPSTGPVGISVSGLARSRDSEDIQGLAAPEQAGTAGCPLYQLRAPARAQAEQEASSQQSRADIYYHCRDLGIRVAAEYKIQAQGTKSKPLGVGRLNKRAVSRRREPSSPSCSRRMGLCSCCPHGEALYNQILWLGPWLLLPPPQHSPCQPASLRAPARGCAGFGRAGSWVLSCRWSCGGQGQGYSKDSSMALVFPSDFAPCLRPIRNYRTFCGQGARRLRLHGAVSFRRSQRDASNGTAAVPAPLAPSLANTVLPEPLAPAETLGPPEVQHPAPSPGPGGRRHLSDDVLGPWARARDFSLLQVEKFFPAT